MEEEQELLPEYHDVCASTKQSLSNKEESNSKLLTNFAIAKMILGILLTIIIQHWPISILVSLLLLLSFIFIGSWFLIVLIFLIILVLLYQISDQLIYWPNVPIDSRKTIRLPSSIGLPSESLYLYCSDGTKLHAVFVKQDPQIMKSVPNIIYFHGNAGNIGHRLANVYDMYRYLAVNILLVEYRGFGMSLGSPSEQGLYQDSQAAISYIRTRTDIDINQVVLFGRSLGGAVAVDCASRTEMRSRVAALIIENTFTSIPDMTKTLFSDVSVLSSLPTWCHKNKYSSKYKMCRILTPTLLLSGLSDTLVPSQMMLQLYHSSASPCKKLYQFPSGSHNETWRCRGYYQALNSFLNEVFRRPWKSNEIPSEVICVSESQVL